MRKNRRRIFFRDSLSLKNVKYLVLRGVLILVVLFTPGWLLAQQQKVTLQVTKASLQDVFKSVNKQTGLDFVYNVVQLKERGPVTLDVKDVTVDSVLSLLFTGTPFEYRFEMNSIIIKKRAAQSSQGLVVSGKVTDERGNVLPGVTVMVKEGKVMLGATTGSDGTYHLTLPEALVHFSIHFSFVGMETKIVVYDGKNTVNVVLKEKAESVDEVVVTGYQTIKKRAMAGSASKVSAEDLLLNGTQTLEQALQGKIPGMMVMNMSGLTGTRQRVRVRGTSTLLGNAEPVWVVDGVIQEDPLPFETNQLSNLDPTNMDMIRDFVGGAISWLNPNDIEDVTVLKDASSTAIYGVKAANGVIVITTKKGQQGRMAVSYNGNFSLSPRLTYDKLELMNSQQRVEVSREAYERGLLLDENGQQGMGYTALALAYKRREITLEEFSREAQKLEEMNADWFKILFRNAFSHSHTISISGGSDKTTYHTSFGVSDNQNTAKGNGQSQYMANMNLSTTLWDCITLNTSVAGSVAKTKAFAGIDPYTYASTTNRAIGCYDESGDRYFYKYDKNGYLYNILNELDNSGNENTLTSVNSTMTIRWRIIEGLSFTSALSFSMSNSVGKSWYSEQSNRIASIRGYNFEEFGETSTKYQESRLPHGGELNESDAQNKTWMWRNQLEFWRNFNGMHALSLMLGQESRSVRQNSYSAKTYGYMHERGRIFVNVPVTVKSTINSVANNLLQNNVPMIVDTENNTMSFYGTLSYMYDERYAVNASIRVDASNRFGQDKSTRYLPIWSFGLRYNMGRERWLQGQDLLSDMSLRLSYGWQGNVASNVSPDLIAKISASDNGGYDLTIKDLPAPKLKWEKVQNLNLGVDFSLFKNKIHGSFEWYKKKTTDMIVQQDVPYENGVLSRPINGGDMSNKGWDLGVSFVPVRTKDWVVSVGLTTGKVYNEIKSLIAPTGSYEEAISGNLNKEGYAVSSFWAFRFAGLNHDNGGPEFDLEGMETDGAAQDATLYLNYAGKLEPDFTGGLSLSVRYKTFTLSSGLYLSLGNQKFLAPISKSITHGIPSEYENMSTEWLKRWRKPGDEKYTNVPSLPDKVSSAMDIHSDKLNRDFNPYELYAKSDIRVVDAWYLRCNSISLSYNVPANKLPRVFQALSFSCSVSNPFQIVSKDFLGRDPEVASGGQPLSRNWSFSLNVSF